VALDCRDAAAHCALAFAYLLTRQHERAVAAAQLAIELNPNLALGYFALGETYTFMGKFAQMIDPLMRCLRLSPRDPLASLFVSLIALGHYHLGNYAEALQYSECALQRRRLYVVLRTLAATLGQLGRIMEARSVLAEMERGKPINPMSQWRVSNPYAEPAHEAHLIDGLRKAGWSELKTTPA
jgi:adenylate cyclase